MKVFVCPLFLVWLAIASASGQLFDNLQKFANRITVGDPTVISETGREGPKSICLEDLDADGRLDFAVSNLDGTVSVAFGQGGLSFSEPVHLQTGASTLRQLICGDFNSDQRPDIVTVDPERAKIHFLWNDGGRRFTLGTPLEAWEIARNLESGDFDGDGKLDLAVAGRNHGLAVFNGDGQGAFREPVIFKGVNWRWHNRYRPVYNIRALRVPTKAKDVLVVTHAQNASAWVVSQTGNRLEAGSTIGLSLLPHDIELAPIDRSIDAKGPVNLIAADKQNGVVHVIGFDPVAWHGGELKALSDIQTIAIPGAPRDVEVVDLDGDGWNDLVVVLRNFNRTITYHNNSGTLEPVTEMPVGVSPREMASGHLNDDSLPDFVIINRESQDVSVALASDEDAGFESLDQVYPVGGEVTGMQLADLNQDGRDDVVQVHRSSGDVTVRLSGKGGRLTAPRFYQMGILPSAMDMRDLNGDGIPDVMTANLGRRGYAPGSVSIRLGQSNGTFGPLQNIPTEDNSNIFAVEAADFDKDGLVDYAVGYFDCRVGFYRGLENGSFKLTRIDRFTYESRVMVTGDWNQDGHIDLAGAGYAGDVVVHVSDGNLLEKTAKRYDYPPLNQGKFGTREITTTDIDKDGDPDLLVGSGKGVMVLRGGEGGSFVQVKEPLKGTDFPASSLTQGDMDGDGIEDLAVACRILSCVTILKGEGDGVFNPALTVDVPAGGFIRAGDVDGDGQTDLVGSGDALWIALSSRQPEAGPPYTGSPQRPPMPQVVINEILASNNRYRFDWSGAETPDCVELFNGTKIQQPLHGWKLRRIDDEGTDDEEVQEHLLQADSLLPGQHLTLFCSTRAMSHRHTGFKLPAAGTTLELLDAKGNLVDRVEYPPMEQNVSFARYQDGVDAFRHNLFPDIDRANVDNGELEPSVFFKGMDFSELKPGQPFRVTARANDDVGVIALSVVYKSLHDPVAVGKRVVLYDDGQHDDGEVLDGFFAGEFPALADGEEIQFYVEATDLNNKNTYLPDGPVFAANAQQLNSVYTMGIGSGTQSIAQGGLRIVEVVTDNETIHFDKIGDASVTPDYAILRNDGTEPVSLNGLTLTQSFFGDGRGDFQLPTTTPLQPGEERRVLFADKPLTADLVAPFPLRKNGETLYLTVAGEMGARTLVDFVATDRLAGDEAMIRMPDGSWSKAVPSAYLQGDHVLSLRMKMERNFVSVFLPYYPGRSVVLERSATLAPGSWKAVHTVEPQPFFDSFEWWQFGPSPFDQPTLKLPRDRVGYLRVRLETPEE